MIIIYRSYIIIILLIIAKTQTTFIPVAIKLFKLILNEMMNQLENVEEDDDEDTDDEVWCVLGIHRFDVSDILTLHRIINTGYII